MWSYLIQLMDTSLSRHPKLSPYCWWYNCFNHCIEFHTGYFLGYPFILHASSCTQRDMELRPWYSLLGIRRIWMGRKLHTAPSSRRFFRVLPRPSTFMKSHLYGRTSVPSLSTNVQMSVLHNVFHSDDNGLIWTTHLGSRRWPRYCAGQGGIPSAKMARQANIGQPLHYNELYTFSHT